MYIYVCVCAHVYPFLKTRQRHPSVPAGVCVQSGIYRERVHEVERSGERFTRTYILHKCLFFKIINNINNMSGLVFVLFELL